MKTKILIGAGAALLLLLNATAFSSFARYPLPEPSLDPALEHCYQAFAGCNYRPGYYGYCTEMKTNTRCTRDYAPCSMCVPYFGEDPVDEDLVVFPDEEDDMEYFELP